MVVAVKEVAQGPLGIGPGSAGRQCARPGATYSKVVGDIGLVCQPVGLEPSN